MLNRLFETDNADEKFTKESLLKDYVRTLDKEGILAVQDDFIRVVGQKQPAEKFIDKLINVFVTAMVETRIITLEERKAKCDELKRKIREIKPAITNNEKYRVEKGRYIKNKIISGVVYPVEISTFIFDDPHFIKGDRGIITDISVNGKILQRNVIFDKFSLTSLDAFRRILHTEADILLTSEEFKYFIKYIKDTIRDKPRVDVLDQTGIARDEKTGEYYFLIFDEKEELHKIVKDQSEMNDEIYCQGIYANKTRAHVKKELNDSKFKEAAKIIVSKIPIMLKDNKSTIILAWSFAALLSELYYEQKMSFPLLFLYGEPESGKSTLSTIVADLMGYRSAGDKLSFSSTNQPLKQAASSTNAYPLLTEEFLLAGGNKDQKTIAFLKQIYNRDKIERGESNKTNSEFNLRAPMLLQGNSYIHNEAVAERCIPIFMGKQHRNLSEKEVREIKMFDYRYFLHSYLIYLINQQDKWKQWFEEAERIIERTSGGSQRAFTATSGIVLGVIMLNDLATSVGENPISQNEIGEIILNILDQREISNPKEPFVRFLEYVQDHHADESISPFKTTLFDREQGKFWIAKTDWFKRFLAHSRENNQEIDEAGLITNLHAQPFIVMGDTPGSKAGKTKSMYGKKIKSIEVDIKKLAEIVPAFHIDLWNDIRETNTKLGNEISVQDLKKDLNFNAGLEEGIKKVKRDLQQLRYQLDSNALDLLSSIGLSFDE